MPVTTPDPQTALIVVDLQKGLDGSPFIHPLAQLIERTQTLLEVFRRLHLPMVLVNVAAGAPRRIEQPRSRIYPKGWADLLPELICQSNDIAGTKRTRGALASTDLEPRLGAHDVKQVVITGVATGTVVEAGAPRRMRRDSTLLWLGTP